MAGAFGHRSIRGPSLPRILLQRNDRGTDRPSTRRRSCLELAGPARRQRLGHPFKARELNPPYAVTGFHPTLIRSARQSAHTASPVPVIREDVISCLHCRMAHEPTLGVVSLWWLVFQGGGRERIGRLVILERAVTPSAAVRE